MGELNKPSAKDAQEISPQEIELKFELEPEALDRLQKRLTLREGALKPKPAQMLVSTYYDTAKLSLSKAGLTLRVREVGKRRIQTLKTEGDGLFTRGEWEWDLVRGEGLNLQVLKTTPFAEVLGAAGPNLKPVFATRMRRAKRLIREAEGEVEAAMDRGEIEAEGRIAVMCELELELKTGKAEALFGLARRLAEAEPLRLSFVTKAERGFRLLANEAPHALTSDAARLDPGMTVAEAFRAIGAKGLRQITANAHTMTTQRRPEAVHQTRVAIRRLRTGFKLFEYAVKDKDYDRIAGELKWLAGELDQARDLDVMIADTFQPAAERFHDQEGLAELGKRLHETRGKAYDRALKALESPRYLTLTLDLAAWLDSGAGRDPHAPLHAARAGAPVIAYAEKSLDRLHRQIKRRGKDLKALSPELRHKLRIRIKRLRYALEFFSGLHADAAGKKAFASALKKLQDSLGRLNDMEVAREQGLLLAETGGRAAGDTAAEGARQAFAAGLMIGARAETGKPLLKKAAKLFDRLMREKPFWRS